MLCYSMLVYFIFQYTDHFFCLFFCSVNLSGKLHVSLLVQLFYITFPPFLGILSVETFRTSLCLLNLFLYFILQVEEVYNFSQDDLLTEDILVLDTHAEVFVWIGQCVDPKEKQNAFEIGQVSKIQFF